MSLIINAFIIALFINLLLFLPAFFFQSDKLTDISYALSFMALAVFGFSQSDSSQLIDYIALILVLVWSIRLGGFLFIRILKEGKDARFDAMRENWFSFLRFWFFQGITVFVIMLPGLLIWHGHKTPNILFPAGILVWLVGLSIESIADYQKYRFKLKDSQQWIDEGIWRASRHPNYLGEIMVWAGFYLFAVSALTGLSRLTALASPLYITFILLRFSGIPLLENSADKKWGANNKYQQYKNNVPKLIPSLSSLNRLLR